MGGTCSSVEVAGGGALVDDAEILFVGRRAAENQVKLSASSTSPAEELAAELAADMAQEPEEGVCVVRGIVPNSERDKRRLKAAVSSLVRSLVQGRVLVASSADFGTQKCTAIVDRELTSLALRRKDDDGALMQIPFEIVMQIGPDAPPGAARYPFGESSVRMQLQRRGDVVVQLDTKEECDAFVSVVRACAKHLNLVSPRPAATEAPPEPSAFHRASLFLRDSLGFAGALLGAPTQCGEVLAEPAFSQRSSGLGAPGGPL